MKEEVWLPIKGYQGKYIVSNLGRIKSFHNYGKVSERILKPSVGRGRMIIGLHLNGKRKSRFLHQLILETFRCPKPAGMNGCHNDGDFRNNHIDNLRWDTSSSNMQDAIKHGKRNFNRGENHGISKLKNLDIPIIRKMLSDGIPAIQVANKFNVVRTAIFNIKSGRAWSHIK